MSKPCCEPGSANADSVVNVEDIALMCKALGHPARVRLLKHVADNGACFFGNLSDVLPLAPSTVSQHVSILKQAGLLLSSPDDQRMSYCINLERLKQLKLLVASL